MTPAGYHELNELPNCLVHTIYIYLLFIQYMSPVDSDTRRTCLDVPPLCQSGVATLQEAEPPSCVFLEQRSCDIWSGHGVTTLK